MMSTDTPTYADIFGEKLQIRVNNYGCARDEIVISEKYTPNGDKVEIEHFDGFLLGYKISFKNGGEEYYNAKNEKNKEITKEGVVRTFVNNKKTSEDFPDGSFITYFEDETIKTQRNADGSFIEYYEHDKIKEKGDKNTFFSYSPEGELQYKIENRKMWINPNYFSFIHIGMKTKGNEEHWTEDFELNPKKKTIICYGGDSTDTARGGNGNINAFVYSLGFTQEQKSNLQMLAHYCPKNNELYRRIRRYKIINYEELRNNDYHREVAKVFMPFIAKKTEQGWKKLPQNELLENMSNILSTTHCFGTNEMVGISHAINEQMQKLGYKQSLINKALKQNLCITNNSRRDFRDNIQMTMIHRYSVCDGPGDEMYDKDYVNAYQTQLDENAEYSKIKGNKSSFINLNKQEVLMIFDKVLSSESTKYSHTEHNQAFFENSQNNLTDVGYKQMKLTQSVVQWWYNNHDEMPNAEDLIIQCGQNAGLEVWTSKSFVSGKLLQKEHNNPLKNPHVLTVAKNRFNNPDIEPEHTGIWKLLQDTKQQGS